MLEVASGTWLDKFADETLLIYYLPEVVDLILLFDSAPKLFPCVIYGLLGFRFAPIIFIEPSISVLESALLLLSNFERLVKLLNCLRLDREGKISLISRVLS